MKQKLFAVGYAVLLTAFTLYIIADTFLIPHAYTSITDNTVTTQVADTVETTAEGTTEAAETNETTETSDASAAPAKTADAESSSSMTPGSHGPGSSHSGGPSGSSFSPYDSSAEEETVTDDAATMTTQSTTTADAAVTSAIDTSEAAVTENSYTDDNISITITTYREYATDIYVADVTVSSPQYLKTALADNTYGRNIKETCSTIADSVGAILAINGDYYGAQESSYVLRNGTLYRSTAGRDQEDLVIWADGSFSFITEGEVSAENLLAQGAQQILSFGPSLLQDGKLQVGVNDEVSKSRTSNPRTAIGIVDENHYLLVVADGRTSASAGLSLYELAEFMQSLGARDAYNLDGGGSSTMVFMGEVINNPTSSGRSIKEREISDIIYIG